MRSTITHSESALMENRGQRPDVMHWVNRAPEGAAADLRRAYALARVGFPIGLFSHTSFIFLFWFLDQPVMAIINVFSSIILGWGVWSAWTLRDVRLATIVALLIEIPLHAALATYYMGFAPFFAAFLLFPVMLMPFLPFFERRTRLGLSFACAAVFVVIGAAAVATEPVRPLTVSWNVFFLIFNAAPVVAFIGIFAAIYETIATSAEEKLAHEFHRAESLLLNILPAPIAARLKDNPELIADEHPQCRFCSPIS